MRILCMGDSMTYGDLVGRGENWVSLVSRETEHDLINAGVNGASTDDMRRRMPKAIEREHPDVVMVMGGANDILQGADILHPLTNIAEMAVTIRNHSLFPVIGLPAPFSPEDPGLLGVAWPQLDAAAETLRQKYAHALRTLCTEQGYLAVDINSELPRLIRQRGERVSLFYMDGVHLTAAGHRLCADIVINAFNALLTK